MILLLWQLASTFFVIGLFTFGGGYAMLSLIQTEVVVNHAWITESQFTDIVAISQMTPGPIGINAATFVGYDVLVNTGVSPALAVIGSLTTTLALVLPSFIVVLSIVKLYRRFSRSPYFTTVMGGLRPAVAGLIGAAAIALTVDVGWDGVYPYFEIVRENFADWKSWLLFAAGGIAAWKYKINPIILILAGGVMGLLLY